MAARRASFILAAGMACCGGTSLSSARRTQASFASKDLPVHCLIQDLLGTWEFFFLSAEEPVEGLLPGCGHTTPNTAASMTKLARADDEVSVQAKGRVGGVEFLLAIFLVGLNF